MLEYGTIDTAIEFLKDGGFGKVGDIGLRLNKEGGLEVMGWTNCILDETVTKAIAVEELQEVKSLFYKMLEESPELSNFVKDREIVFCLGQSGKDGMRICSEKNNTITWANPNMK